MSIGVLGRLAWALATAGVGAFWIRRARRLGLKTSFSLSFVKALGFVCLALSLFWGVVWLTVACFRITYPFELEWIGGAMRDHVERFLHHQPFYVPPGGGWFPYEYPPLYPWVCAQLLKWFPLPAFVVMRGVSIFSTIGCAVLIALWTKQLTAGSTQSTLWSTLAAGLFLAAYRVTGAWYDLERLDMLFLFLSLLGIYVLDKGRIGTLTASFAFTLAFFTKQQALLFIVAAVLALWHLRDWRSLCLLLGLTGGGCVVAVLLLNRATNGWFWFYCFRVPLSNGIHAVLALLFLYNDLPLYAPLIILIALLGRQTVHQMPLREKTLLFAMTAAGVLGSWLSRAHWGGDQNVLMTAYLFIGIMACTCAAYASESHSYLQPGLLGLTLAQFVAIAYNPLAQIPHRQNREAGQRYLKEVQTLERGGEVLCLDHGGFTVPPHFQIMGLLDVLNTLHQMPLGLARALEAKRYSAILTEGLPGTKDVFGQMLYTFYRPVQRWNETTPWVVTGFLTPAPQRPVYIWRPR
ncbi:ArnT family glycosyltransferase [Chthonomonas calidirosea]|uniref:ArnT family glycosyltransferase n=1 Tax=Chthonomonas calidirosea TaxID=454171 RepID=UPI0006EC71AC|nr:hypothetical protein [Chthonomonas calidirosea]CEK20505.1 hypothetical protein CP488_02879 [Chthonomonas calidirosea]